MNCRTRLNEREQMNKQKITRPVRHCKWFGIQQFAFCNLQFAICIFFGCSDQSRAADTADPRRWVAENMAPLVELYRHLHQTPELSLKEKETSTRMAKELRDAGVTVTTNVGGYGVVGVLANGPGKVLMLRSDM